MNPCKVIDCDKWTGTGEYCFRHCDKETNTVTLAPARRKNNTQLVTPEQSRGLAVFAPGGKNRSFNRKHVRRNSPISYYTGFSIDMLKDMDTGKISTKHIAAPITVREVQHTALIATLAPSNGGNPDA